MKKLIDADALLEPVEEEFNKLCDAFNETSIFKAPHDVALYGALMQEAGAFAGMIVNAQPIDAVPVIRCNDCIYYSDQKSGEYWHICRFYDAPKRVDGFCDDAEPKVKK